MNDTRSPAEREITWISRGRSNCKGNTMTLPEANGTVLRTTCACCSLEWTVAVSG